MTEAYPGRLPSELLAEVARLPVGMLSEVIEARQYMTTKHLYDGAKNKQELGRSPTMDLVREITFTIAAEEIAKKREEMGVSA